MDLRRRRAPLWDASSPTIARGQTGVLNQGLDEAEVRGRLVVSMKDDWAKILEGASE